MKNLIEKIQVRTCLFEFVRQGLLSRQQAFSVAKAYGVA